MHWSVFLGSIALFVFGSRWVISHHSIGGVFVALGLMLLLINRGSQAWKDHRTYRDQIIRERAKRAFALGVRR